MFSLADAVHHTVFGRRENPPPDKEYKNGTSTITMVNLISSLRANDKGRDQRREQLVHHLAGVCPVRVSFPAEAAHESAEEPDSEDEDHHRRHGTSRLTPQPAKKTGSLI